MWLIRATDEGDQKVSVSALSSPQAARGEISFTCPPQDRCQRPWRRKRSPAPVANPQSATVELRHGDQVREGATDDLGRFSFSDVPVGPIQLSVESPSGGKVVTEWMVA